MGYTIRFFVIIFLLAYNLFAFNYDVKEDSFVGKISFKEKPVLIGKKVDKLKLIFVFRNKGEIFSKDFLGLPISYIKGYEKSGKYLLEIAYVERLFAPELKIVGNQLNIRIPFVGAVAQNQKVKNPYMRIIVGLIIILLLIIIMYIFLKVLFKRRLNQNIAGVGRFLGKMDILPGISLLFVEIGSKLYIISSANSNLTLIDKIDDEDEIVKLKEGFSRQQDFSSYLRFFSKGIDKKDVEITKINIKEKVESLRKK